MRRPYLLAGPAACLLLVAVTLYLRREQLASTRLPQNNVPQWLEDGKAPPAPSVSPVTSSVSSMETVAPQDDILSRKKRLAYVDAIMNSGAVLELPRLQCPRHNPNRYLDLQATTKAPPGRTIQYFFALDLRQSIAILPRLLGSVVKVIRFLGPQHCALSIVEGNSDDGTGEVLAALRPNLEKLGVTYHLSTTTINPKKGDRIAALAQLRNLALQPILDANTQSPNSGSPNHRYTAKTTVVFLNDVAACPEDILELLHQRRFLRADMVCGMDWTYVGQDPTFYDVWIARTMQGDSFFDIPPDGNWNSAWNLFWNDAGTQARYNARRPFQVFSCWNGGVVFGAAPLLLGESGVRFRKARQGECYQGEPQLFCKDLWWRGFGKIAVVPTVNLEYSNEAGEKIKKAKGYVSQFVDVPQWVDENIDWRAEPPEKVKCMADYADQFFEAWNKTQPVV